ncbi:uncharacterized protein K02A2.6-like [Aedes albopictus]|uniref:Reverse transcriptase n=1 Tax=Aedes albopictus TaxID=7160 RepID=A0ABM1YAX7_AEDAL
MVVSKQVYTEAAVRAVVAGDGSKGSGYTSEHRRRKIESQYDKRSKLLYLGGSDLRDIYDNLPDTANVPHVVKDPPYYEVAIAKLDAHFEPFRRRTYERHQFRQISQNPSERFSDFLLRLRAQVKRCEYDSPDEMILDQIVERCASSKLKQKMLKRDMTLEEVEALGTSLEESEKKLREFGGRNEVQKVNSWGSGKVQPRRSQVANRWGQTMQNRVGEATKMNSSAPFQRSGFRSDPVCFACGRRGHVKGAEICPARQAACMRCRNIGHFARQCQKRPNSGPVPGVPAKRVRLIEGHSQEDKKDEFIFYAMGNNTFRFAVGGVEIPMTIDSGAAANIVDKETWKEMKEAGIKVWDMTTQIDKHFTCYASESPMKILGSFMSTIEGGGKQTVAKFYVAEKGQQCLLGDDTAKRLQVLKVGFDIGNISNEPAKEFPKFKGVVVEIPIDQSVQPVQQAYRRAPYALEDKVEEKLRLLLAQGIIEKVRGPSPWVSPMVPVLKESGDVRLCIDMRRANQAVLRETHPLPLVDELLGSVSGAVVFSKIDIKDAYHQIEISEQSRPITTFVTKNGLYRFKRLMFGISCAPEIFQKTMENILAGLEGIIVYLDDVVLFGATEKEHNERLQALRERLDEYGILLNHDKCVYNVEEVVVLGHVLNKNGIRPTEHRMAAIRCFREPKNVSELRSFLGLVTYVGRFILHLATKTEPLRQLLRGGAVFRWEDKHREAFKEIKEAISDIGYLGFFNKEDTTKLIADASPDGLGADLTDIGYNHVLDNESIGRNDKKRAHTINRLRRLVNV